MELKELETRIEEIERIVNSLTATNIKQEKTIYEDYECDDCGYTNNVEIRFTYDESSLSTEEMLNEVDNITRIIGNIKHDIYMLKKKGRETK